MPSDPEQPLELIGFDEEKDNTVLICGKKSDGSVAKIELPISKIDHVIEYLNVVKGHFERMGAFKRCVRF
jgi:hypothetical protein